MSDAESQLKLKNEELFQAKDELEHLKKENDKLLEQLMKQEKDLHWMSVRIGRSVVTDSSCSWVVAFKFLAALHCIANLLYMCEYKSNDHRAVECISNSISPLLIHIA